MAQIEGKFNNAQAFMSSGQQQMSTAKIKEDIDEEDLERSERDDAISSLSRELQIIKKGKQTQSPAPDKSAKLAQ